MTVDFSSETVDTRDSETYLTFSKQNKTKPSILYSVNKLFHNEDGIKTFSDEGKPKGFVVSRLALNDLVRGSSSGWKDMIPKGHGTSGMKKEQQKWLKYMSENNKLFFTSQVL